MKEKERQTETTGWEGRRSKGEGGKDEARNGGGAKSVANEDEQVK